MGNKKTILVAPLNWGLGHATRCIPIIQELIKNNFNVLIASDGNALKLLQKEFPTLENITLPSYNISYPKRGGFLKWKLLLKFPHIKKAVLSEKKIIQKLVSEKKIQGIISDNRFGVRNSKIPSVYLTHQLKVLSGNTTNLSSKIHQNIINKFDECWVPDISEKFNLSGELSHSRYLTTPIYIGPLSRMKRVNREKKYDILILLSGPEPQRSILEKQLIKEFKGDSRNILLIQGIVENKQKTFQLGNISCINYMLAHDLENAINESELIICRSGYTTIMDLAILEKKAFFIPTPGQFEQEYLAHHIKERNLAPFCNQEDFTKEKLKELVNYSRLTISITPVNFTNLFRLFEGE